MKFNIGDRIIILGNSTRGIILNYHVRWYQVHWDNEPEPIWVHFDCGDYWELEDVYDSPLYQALT